MFSRRHHYEIFQRSLSPLPRFWVASYPPTHPSVYPLCRKVPAPFPPIPPIQLLPKGFLINRAQQKCFVWVAVPHELIDFLKVVATLVRLSCPLSFSASLCTSVYLSPSLSHYVRLSISLLLCLTMYISLSLSFSVSLCISLYLSPSLSHYVRLSISLLLCLTMYVSLSLSFSVSLCISLYLSPSLSHYVRLSISLREFVCDSYS